MMESIELCVTKEMARIAENSIEQRQILISSSTQGLRKKINSASYAQQFAVKLCDNLELNFSDSQTIFRAHNSSNAEAFDNLYELLVDNQESDFKFDATIA